jgi:hypothetical protein
MPVDLSGVSCRSDPRVRIRTNLEIYWDRIFYTADEEPARVTEDAGASAFREPLLPRLLPDDTRDARRAAGLRP